MSISPKTDYATRAVLALAIADQERLNAQDLSQQVAVPEPFMKQILMATSRCRGGEIGEGPDGWVPPQSRSVGHHARADRQDLPGSARPDRVRHQTRATALCHGDGLQSPLCVGGGA